MTPYIADEPLLVGELFAGVAGLGRAVEFVFNAVAAWFAEFDEAPSKVLAHHYPDIPNYGDVTKIDFRWTRHTHIRAGGFPCQDVSLSGRRKGLQDGTRSGLWSEFRRSIEEDRPDWVVIENVPGLCSANAMGSVEPCPWCLGDGTDEHALRALGAVLADLADLGFDAEWTGIRASDVGAPHKRLRIFILAWPSDRSVVTDDDRDGLEGVRRVDTVGRDPDGRGGADGDGNPGEPASPALRLLPTPTASQSGNTPEEHLRKKPGRQVVTDLGIIAEHGLIASGGRLLPTPDAYAGSRGGSQAPEKRREGRHAVSLADVTEHSLLGTPRTVQGIQNDLRDPNVIGNPRGRLEDQIALLPTTDWGVYAGAVHRWEKVLGRPAPSPVRYDGKGGKPKLNPEFTEWMMGWDEGWVTDPAIGLTANEQKKACGNGVVTLQAVFALFELLERPGVPSLFAEAVAA